MPSQASQNLAKCLWIGVFVEPQTSIDLTLKLTAMRELTLAPSVSITTQGSSCDRFHYNYL